MQLSSSDYLILALAVVLGIYFLFLAFLFFVGRKFRVLSWISLVPNCIVLFKRLLSDSELPVSRKVILLVLVGYLILPIDIIPDFIPIIGQIDDVIIVVFALRLLLRSIDQQKIRTHWSGSEKSLNKLLKLT